MIMRLSIREFPGKQNQFSSSFSIERKWLFEVESNSTDIQNTIPSFRYNTNFVVKKMKRFFLIFFSQRWDHYTKYNIEHSTLFINRHSNKRYSKQFQHVLTITQIQYLKILQKNIPISFFFDSNNSSFTRFHSITNSFIINRCNIRINS